MSSLLEAHFRKRFRSGVEIIVDSLQLQPASMVTVLFGPSGAGKSTVLRCIAGLERPDQGTIRFRERDWIDTARKVFVPARARNIGLVPQEFGLFPHLTVEQNITYGIRRAQANKQQAHVTEIIRWLGLNGLENRFPKELSGGQQQRVALGRAIAPTPDLLLLDEPLGALDSPTRVRLRTELRQMLTRVGTPALLVTHDRTDALALGDDVIVMNQGKIEQHGPVADVFSHPANVSVAEIVAMETVQAGRVIERGELITVAVGNCKLLAVAGSLESNAVDVFVCIRAEDVIVVKGDAVRGSARNSLTGVVKGITPEAGMVGVDLDCGFPLRALLTRQACEELALRPGERIQALVKAPQVHLISRTNNDFQIFGNLAPAPVLDKL